MSASTPVGDFTGNQLRLAEELEMSLNGLSRSGVDTRKLRAEQRRRILERRGIKEGSEVRYSGVRHPLFVDAVDYQEGVVILSSKGHRPIGIRVAIKKFLLNVTSLPIHSEDGGKTWT